LWFVCTGIALALTSGAAAADPELRWIRSHEETSTSEAVVVDGRLPLAHTGQLWPEDDKGKIVGRESADAQCETVIDRLEPVLREVRSNFGDLVRLNVYAARADVVPAFRAAFHRRAAGKGRPAVTVAVGGLARPGALVALDAVAVALPRPDAPTDNGNSLVVPRFGGRAAVLPAGPRLFVSGQADPGANLAEATRRTMEGLAATLKHLGVDRSAVVQVRAFFQPIAKSVDVERAMAAFFGPGGAPPLVLVEWRMSQPIEIELVAAAGTGQDKEALTFVTPPGLKPSPVFSRVARVARGPLIYVGGQYGPAGATGAKQVEAIFGNLGKIVAEAGSDLHHLVKATYLITDDESSRALNELRPRYFDASRPPAASKISVAGVGVAECSIALDMIAVPTNDARSQAAQPGRGE